jgi:hypothetical protein
MVPVPVPLAVGVEEVFEGSGAALCNHGGRDEVLRLGEGEGLPEADVAAMSVALLLVEVVVEGMDSAGG